jgi:hypothetical protein
MAPLDPDTAVRLAELLPDVRWRPSITEEGGEVQTPWVPYGPGLEIPVMFDYGGEGPFNWQIRIAVFEGQPRCIAMKCDANESGPITPEALHRFPLGRMVEEATLMSARPVDEIPRRKITWENPEEARRQQAAAAAQFRSRRRGRNVATDEFLEEVARVYRENVAKGKPSKAVADHFKYPPSSARRLVRLARDRGFLGDAQRGKAGEFHQQEEDSNG